MAFHANFPIFYVIYLIGFFKDLESLKNIGLAAGNPDASDNRNIGSLFINFFVYTSSPLERALIIRGKLFIKSFPQAPFKNFE